MIVDTVQVFKKIRQVAYEKTLDLMTKAAAHTLHELMSEKQFLDVTGNALTSISIGVYYKGHLERALYGADYNEEPTRVTLKKGEVYNLPEYYDGSDARADDEGIHRKPFVGKRGRGGQWGPTLGKWHLHRFHPNVSNTWTMIAAIPVSYAGYNEHIINTMQQAYDSLAWNVKGFATVR